MATQVIRPIKATQYATGFPPEVHVYKEAASQAYVTGDLVYIASGYVTVCSTDPTKILGIALQDAHNTTAGAYDAPVEIINSRTTYEMNLNASTTALATHLGVAFGIVQNAAGKWTVDATDTTNTRVTVIGISTDLDYDSSNVPFQRAVGDTYGVLQVRFLPTGGGSSVAIGVLQGGP